jgi:hypothetical protein
VRLLSNYFSAFRFPKYRKCDLSLLNRCIDAPPLLAIVVTITFYGVWF